MTRGPRKSASSGWAIRSRNRDTASTMPSVVRPTYRPRRSAALGTPRGYSRAASSLDPRRVQIEHEAEIWILPAGASHFAQDRQVDGEHEQMRGIVFEHFHGRASRPWRPAPQRSAGPRHGVVGFGRIRARRTAYIPGSRSWNAPSWGAYAAIRLASRRSAKGPGVTRVVSSPSVATDLGTRRSADAG